MNRFEITTRIPEVCRAQARPETEQVLALRLCRAAEQAGVILDGPPTHTWEADPDAFSHDGPTFSWIVTTSATYQSQEAAA